MAYIEARAEGKDNRVLANLDIRGAETTKGEKAWVVSKEFESEHHASEDMVFLAPDEIDELGEYVKDCLLKDMLGEEYDGDESEQPESEGY